MKWRPHPASLWCGHHPAVQRSQKRLDGTIVNAYPGCYRAPTLLTTLWITAMHTATSANHTMYTSWGALWESLVQPMAFSGTWGLFGMATWRRTTTDWHKWIHTFHNPNVQLKNFDWWLKHSLCFQFQKLLIIILHNSFRVNSVNVTMIVDFAFGWNILISIYI